MLISTLGFSQDIFRIFGGQDNYTTSFKLINNLIVIPVEVNGSELNFLLDTGVDNTIMFNLTVEDSLKLKNAQTIRIRGLGEGTYMDAIRSTKNLIRIGKIINGNHLIYAIPGDEFNLTSSMGITISGIIGGELFKNFVVKINYSSKRLKFYKPEVYSYKGCKKCEEFELEFHKDRPYMNVQVYPNDNKQMTVKLLIDLGGSDALWLFEDSDENIQVPDKFFEDYLGKGLSGSIHGKRSKISKIQFGRYFFKDANVAYPDSLAIEHAYKNKERNGSLGSGILKRFKVVFDYSNKRLIFKGPSRYYNDPFLHNMSGIEVSHNGSMLIPERRRKLLQGDGNDNSYSTIEILYSYVYALKPSFKIIAIRKGSPAHKAGLQVGDIILKINGKSSYEYKLDEIIHMFSTKEGKQIKLLIERDGEELTYSFKLQKML